MKISIFTLISETYQIISVIVIKYYLAFNIRKCKRKAFIQFTSFLLLFVN